MFLECYQGCCRLLHENMSVSGSSSHPLIKMRSQFQAVNELHLGN